MLMQIWSVYRNVNALFLVENSNAEDKMTSTYMEINWYGGLFEVSIECNCKEKLNNEKGGNIMLVSAILVALIAIGSQWWFSHTVTRTWLYPVWSGFLVAVVMGEPILGMQAAAYIQLTYLGWITAGGTMPGNLMVAGIFGTALTIISGASPNLAPTFAVPFSLLGILINQAYMTINSFWIHKADKYLEEGNIRGVRLMNYVPSGLTATVLYGIPAFALVYFGGDFATKALAAIPQPMIDALNVVGALMPALGIAMLLSFLGKKKIVAFFFIGYFLTIYAKIDTMAITVFAALVAILIYIFTNSGNEEEDVVVAEEVQEERIRTGKQLTKKELIKHFLLGYSSETCYNYERLQALGTANAMVPVVRKLYDTKEEQAKALKKYMVFFNTEPSWIGTVIHGVAASMEEECANGADIDAEDINAVRTGLMGPMAGIGDTVSQGIFYPILAGIACSLALAGNIAGPILFEVGYKVLMLGMGYAMYMMGYKQGKNAIVKILSAGTLNRITEAFSIVGLMVVGNMAATRVNIKTPIAFKVGEVAINMQNILNSLLPGVLPLIMTLLVWKLLSKKVKPTYIIVIIFVVGVITSLIGLLAVA